MSYWEKIRKYQRERQARWDATHLRTVSTKVTVAEAKRLHEACEKEGITVYALVRWFLSEWLEERRKAVETGATDAVMYLFFRGRAETLAEPDAAERVMV